MLLSIHSLLKNSSSTLKITWTQPNWLEELNEYFDNEKTKEYLSSKGISFSKKELIDTLSKGHLVSFPKEKILSLQDSSQTENISTDPKAFGFALEDPYYSKSFNSMEKTLLKDKTISLPAPIILKLGNSYYGFAGSRRSNLAFKYGIPLKVWMVPVSLSKTAALNLPEGWRFIGSPKDGFLHNNELNWHAIVVGVPPYKSIVVIDETSKTIGEIDSFDELP